MLGKSNTPILLRRALLATWVLTLAFAAVIADGWDKHRLVVQTIGLDAAPSVEAAHSIEVLVETIDASLVNELLRTPGVGAEHVRAFEKARVDIGIQLVAAARNITYGDTERLPLERIEDAFGQYLMAAQAARAAHDNGELEPMLVQYRRAYRTLKKDLLPAAIALNDANEQVLTSTYEEQSSRAHWIVLLTVFIGAALLLVLLGTQVFLFKRFRRIVNPAYAAATAMTTWLLFYATHSFAANRDDVKGMKEDAYDSVAALLDSRAHAYEANAAESRWLLDAKMRSEHDMNFTGHVGKLASFSDGQTFESILALGRERNSIYALRVQHGDDGIEAGRIARDRVSMPGFSGSLAKGLDNITFPDPDPIKDEPTQSLETLRTLGIYVGLDNRLRRLENEGRHVDAINFCLGMAPGESNWAFFEFDQALGRWLSLNQEWMARYREQAFADVAGLPYGALIVSLAVLALAFFGLRPRLREYAD